MPPIPPLRPVLELLGLLALATIVVYALIVPSWRELRHVRRRLRLARDVEAARTSTAYRDPGGPRLPGRAPRRAGPLDRRAAGGALSAVQALRPTDPRVDVEHTDRIDRVVGVTLTRDKDERHG
jgi:hypothetical protein